MKLEDFVEKFAEALEIEAPGSLTAETKFRDLEEWSSLAALSLMAMVDEEYEITLKGDEVRSAQTLGDLISIISSKL